MKGTQIALGVVSLLVPGLGQMFQERVARGVLLLLLAIVLYTVALGWIVAIYAAYDAATWDSKPTPITRGTRRRSNAYYN